jgi:hypothetical protein
MNIKKDEQAAKVARYIDFPLHLSTIASASPGEYTSMTKQVDPQIPHTLWPGPRSACPHLPG